MGYLRDVDSGNEFRSIFEASLDAIMLTTPDGKILAANPAACRMLARAEEELIRLGREAVVDPSDPRVAVAIRTRAETGRFQGELTFLRHGGEPFPVEVSTSVFVDGEGQPKTTMVFRDVSERKRSEAALRVSEEKFSKVFHTSPDGLTLTRMDNGRYLEVNPGFTELSGYRPEDVIGRTSLELGVWVKPEERRAFVEALSEHGQVINLEAEFAFKDGVRKTCLVSARPLEVGGVPCILSTTRDITERQRMAESLQRIQRLESLGVLAGGIAHDFNNMLGGLFGFLELAREGLRAGKLDRLPIFLDRALGIHERARGLTKQLLTFSKGGAPQRKVLSLEPLIRLTTTFALSGSNVVPRFSLAPGLWPCDCDETQIGQVLDNLVRNAQQAMADGGEVRVSARNVLHPADHVGPFVEISVADQGPGIAPDNVSKIFDPFFSTKATGHGLGLATVFSVVHRHGGWIDVESAPGNGATFHVFLPASPQQVTEVEEEAETSQGKGGRILVLDDDEAILEVTGAILEGLGYEPTLCHQSAQAVERYREAMASRRPFAAALLDLTIPGEAGGVAAARSIRSADPKAVLVAVSGYSEVPTRDPAGACWFNEQMTKPYLQRELAGVLLRVLTGPPEIPPAPPSR